MNKALFFLLIFAFKILEADCADTKVKIEDPMSYGNLSPFQKAIFDEFLAIEIPSGSNINDVLTTSTSVRNKVRLAEALLFRNKPGDIQDAITILKWLLPLQNQDVNSKDYGVWSSTPAGKKFDQNWREFIGCELILIRKNYSDLLPDELLMTIDTCLKHAARGAIVRNVAPEYTNIAIMSAFLTEYVGTTFSEPKLKSFGIEKATDVFNLYQKHKTFSEYNSPTYYGVNMVAIALWRKYAKNQEIREMGEILEKEFWHEIALFYHAGLQNMPGPHFRSYGMDMQKYNSIIGIWIALLLDGKYPAPLPRKHGSKYFELSNIAPIFHLGWVVPQEDVIHFEEFVSERFEKRLIYSRNSVKEVTMQMKKDWMMGGLWGYRRSWSQIKTGTIHWKNENEIGWLLVPGDGKTNVRIANDAMDIYLADESTTEINLYVYASGIEKENFKNKKWELPGINIKMDSRLKINEISVASKAELGQKCAITENYPLVLRLSYKIPKGRNTDKPLIQLHPQD